MLGGTSKARNKTILSIFSYVNIGERGGTGIPLIMNATKEENYPNPLLEDSFNPDQTRLTIFIKNNENLHFEDKNLHFEDKNLHFEDKNLHFEAIIQNSHYKTDVKANLLKIENSFRSKMFFGRGDIVQLLNCSSGAAYNLLNYLLELKVIDSVKGHGKGKYKFK